MPVIKGLEWTFDTVSDKYEKFRPGYPRELYKAVFDYIPIGPASNAVEIGIGAGQATPPVLEMGCALTAVEYGENFSSLCREKFASFKGFSVINDRFENVTFPDNKYDLVYSASAFHWIPEDIGYAKVYDMLKSGGAFARFANHPFRDKGNPELAEAVDRLYAKYYYPFYGKEPQKLTEYTEEQAEERANIALKYGFTDIKHALFYRTRAFSAEEYVELLGTYSDHISIEEKVRTEFFAAIAEAINAHGGVLTLYDTIDLELARKP